MYHDVRKPKGEAVAEIILDLPEELISELETRAKESGKSTSELVREALELYFRQRPVRKQREDISDRPEFRRAIQIQDDMRHRSEGSGFSGSEFIRRMRDGE